MEFQVKQNIIPHAIYSIFCSIYKIFFYFVTFYTGKRKVHYLLEDKREMVEEYNVNTNVVVRRAWRKKNNFGKPIGWSIEIGEPEMFIEDESTTSEIQESSNMVCSFSIIIIYIYL